MHDEPTLEQLQQLTEYISIMNTDHLNWMLDMIEIYISSGARLERVLRYLGRQYARG